MYQKEYKFTNDGQCRNCKGFEIAQNTLLKKVKTQKNWKKKEDLGKCLEETECPRKVNKVEEIFKIKTEIRQDK